MSAFQSGEWNTVIEITRWMQERLLHVQARDGSPQAREAERMRLRKGLSERTMEGNQLRPEGIEDQYVFVPGATVKAIALDEGQPGLKPPAQSRTWFEVTFAKRSQALRDGAGIPIRSIAVGVNVSADGFVLKGSVIGNLDVDTEWIFYDWNDVL
ncbi:MAG: hypothetical protein GWP08_02725 [Nitrospiraceae bacterium]|nr:hypothetical protein [Nitrospiraceae bacterium]